MPDALTFAPTPDPRVFRAPDGTLKSPPAGWDCLPPGDAGLTRRVKAAGPSWVVQEKKGRKLFSRGLWASAETIDAARAALEAERSTDVYAKRRESDARRRDRDQAAYVTEFEGEVLAFLRLTQEHEPIARELAARVTAHATPVGSGTVARTERISVERRAEAAVIAWMRHETTAYDTLAIPRVKGERRAIRRELAEISRAVLDAYRRPGARSSAECPLRAALTRPR